MKLKDIIEPTALYQFTGEQLRTFISALLNADPGDWEAGGPGSKNVWNYDDVVEYTGFTYGSVKNYVSRGEIPHYKPLGGKVFFKKSEIEEWLLRNRVSSNEELETKAANWGK